MSISHTSQKQKLLLKIKEKLRLLDQQKDWFLVLSPWLRTELTYTSNSLEGNTLSLIETGIVINDNQSVGGKNLREIYEATNHAKAWDYIINNVKNLDTKALNQNHFLTIHSHILKNIDEQNTGKYRSVAVRISGSQTIFPNPLKVDFLMTQTFDWLIDKAANTSQTAEQIIEIAILTHLKLIKIHPFSDGNGRAVRLFMNTILMQNKFPPINIEPENRKEYLESLELSTTEKPEEFVNFCLSQYNKNLDNYLETFSH